MWSYILQRNVWQKNNSVGQIWKNLNTVCSFKSSNATKSVFKLMSNGIEISNAQDICSEFNHYFCTVGESLLKHSSQAHYINDINYKKYCVCSTSNSMFCEPVQIDELIQLINNLNPNKGAPGQITLDGSAKGNDTCHYTAIFIHYKSVFVYWCVTR